MPDLDEVQGMERDASSTKKPNFAALSQDFPEYGTAQVKTEPIPKEEIKSEEPNKETELKVEEEKKEEPLKAEETKEETKEDKSEEITAETTELKLDEVPLELKDEALEEGSWRYVAKELQIEGVEDDSPEAFIEAVKKPLVAEIETLRSQKMQEFLNDVDPEIRLEVYLAKTGMTKEQIRAPYLLMEQYRNMDPVALVRADLEAQYDNKAKPEWIDQEIEEMIAKDGAIEHHRERILMGCEARLEEITKERQELYDKHNVNQQNFLNDQKKLEVETIAKTLNDMSTFMGRPIPEDIRKTLSTNFTKGAYNDLLSDNQLKAEFILYKKLGSQILKNIETESYKKGKLESSKELANTPPLDNGGAGRNTTTEKKGAFDALKTEFGGWNK